MPSRRTVAKLLLLAAVSGCLGCSKRLDRESAAKMIREHLGLPSAQSKKMWIGKVTLALNEMGYMGAKMGDFQAVIRQSDPDELDWLNNYSPLLRAGMLELAKTGGTEFVQYYILSLTDKIKPDVTPIQRDQTGHEYVILHYCDLDLNEVTGIRFDADGTRATVDYTLRMINLTSAVRVMFPNQQVATIARQLNFVLYDDGWRIEQ